MVMTCIVMVVTSVLYEWCRHLRMKQIATKKSAEYQRMGEDVQPPPAQESGPAHEPGSTDQEAEGSSQAQSQPKKSLASRGAAYLQDLKCPCHVKQSLYYFLEVTISLLLMLAIMTFNVWLCLAVVFGRGIGYFVFSRSTNRLVLGSESDCCI